MDRLSTAITKLNKFLFSIAAFGVLFMGFTITYDAIMRYVFNRPSIWINEISAYLLVTTAFLASGYTLFLKGHVKVDVLYPLLKPKIRSILQIASYIVLLFFITVLTIKSFQMAYLAYEMNWVSTTLLKTPLYIPQIFVPIGGAALFLQALVLVLEEIKTLKGGV